MSNQLKSHVGIGVASYGDVLPATKIVWRERRVRNFGTVERVTRTAVNHSAVDVLAITGPTVDRRNAFCPRFRSVGSLIMLYHIHAGFFHLGRHSKYAQVLQSDKYRERPNESPSYNGHTSQNVCAQHLGISRNSLLMVNQNLRSLRSVIPQRTGDPV